MYRLKMSKHCLLIICVICELYKISYCIAKKNSTFWSTVNLLVDSRNFIENPDFHTTESFGIIFRKNESNVTSTNENNWTKIEITVPTYQTSTTANPKYHATFGSSVSTKSPNVADGKSTMRIDQNVFSTQLSTPLVPVSTNRSIVDEVSPAPRTPLKGKNGETGHAFFYDDDDDDDDDYDDDDDDDDEYIQRKEEDEEDVDDDKNVEEAAEAVDTEQQEEYDTYSPETRPPIILRTRRKKTKKKRGKKHGTIKIKDFKKLRKFMLPLLLAYKLKFFTLVPLLLGGLVLIVATTGFAGFFFALFAVGLGLRHQH